MSAVKVKDYSHGVILVAHDLHSGLGVYRDRQGAWIALDRSNLSQAMIVFNEQHAETLLDEASVDVDENKILDPYLVQLDETGLPVHIRERLRLNGPSVDYGYPESFEVQHVSVQ